MSLEIHHSYQSKRAITQFKLLIMLDMYQFKESLNHSKTSHSCQKHLKLIQILLSRSKTRFTLMPKRSQLLYYHTSRTPHSFQDLNQQTTSHSETKIISVLVLVILSALKLWCKLLPKKPRQLILNLTKNLQDIQEDQDQASLKEKFTDLQDIWMIWIELLSKIL